MEYTVEGEDLSPEEFSDNAGRRINGQRRVLSESSKDGYSAGANPKAILSVEPGQNTGRAGASVKNHIIRRGRMPPLPKDDIKIVIKLRGRLNISKIGPTVVADAITTKASIEASEGEADTICPNLQQNIVVIAIQRVPPYIPEQFLRTSLGKIHFQGPLRIQKSIQI
ncbi:hypothetical protein HPB49_011913 [Dermacentor silvarum]|uniref:Uncharacterized protein n=1 Tax=Dermacentor silvarum TaxID=543639 RepID=A0ACB8CEX4_DERSI|nr:hypothetical protein HPB49_011913 [Dermacentor silvarum]